jgi:hypothetical protein
MKSYTLSISPDYVKSWGVWEAIRELLQNAFDQRDLDPNCVVTFSHNPLEETVTIGTSTGRLSPQSLLLGISSKSKDRALRGQFGEGYKLAMLVLVRSGHDVRLYNGPELWLPRIKFSESYGCDVLTIEAANIGGPADGVKFMVTGISTEEWMAISQKVNPNQTSDTILDENKGDVFVGGLYVTTLPELHKGYAFSPKSLTLDRDRGMVSNFDVRYATSKLWTHREKVDPDSVYKMLETDAPDVQYVDCHASSTSTITKSAYAFYTSKYGNAVPVATQ